MRDLAMAAGCLALLLATPAQAGAPVPDCEPLTGAQQGLAQQLLAEQFLYDCCDRTIAECLADTPTCRLAVRLAGSVCRQVGAGQDAGTIARGLSRRARSMTTSQIYSIDLGARAAGCVGPDTAQVVLVEYACARCPFCARLTPLLYQEVTAGRLQGRVRFCLKPFPIRSHPFSKEANLGLTVAIGVGRLWPVLLQAYATFDEFGPEQYTAWAAAAGIDPAAFDSLAADPTTADLLVESKKEGLRNQVDATPTFYINGRRYVGDMDLEEMVDVLVEEAERRAGLIYLP